MSEKDFNPVWEIVQSSETCKIIDLSKNFYLGRHYDAGGLLEHGPSDRVGIYLAVSIKEKESSSRFDEFTNDINERLKNLEKKLNTEAIDSYSYLACRKNIPVLWAQNFEIDEFGYYLNMVYERHGEQRGDKNYAFIKIKPVEIKNFDITHLMEKNLGRNVVVNEEQKKAFNILLKKNSEFELKEKQLETEAIQQYLMGKLVMDFLDANFIVKKNLMEGYSGFKSLGFSSKLKFDYSCKRD